MEVPDPSQDTFDMDIEERMRADEITSQVERAVLAATSALRSFANPPGRKVMLLFSGGWPYNPGQWLLRDPARLPYTNVVARGEERIAVPKWVGASSSAVQSTSYSQR